MSTDNTIPFGVPPGRIGGRSARVTVGTGTAGTDLTFVVPPGRIGGRSQRVTVGSGTAATDLSFAAPPGRIAGRSQRIRVGGTAAHLYVCGDAYGPTFGGLTVGGGGLANAIVAGVGWDGSLLWAWSDGAAPGYQWASAICADTDGCYAAFADDAGDWHIVALSPGGTERWRTACGTASNPPSHIEVSGGRVYACGTGSRDMWVLDTASGAVVWSIVGYDAAWDFAPVSATGYTGTVATSPGSTVYLAQDYTSGAYVSAMQRVAGGALAANEWMYQDTAGYGGAEHKTQVVGMPGVGAGYWVWLWTAHGWVGQWESGHAYSTADVVSHGAQAWVALRANQNVEPTEAHSQDWRGWWWYSDPIDSTFYMQRVPPALDASPTIFTQGSYASYPRSTLPAVDPVTGMIVTNVYDPGHILTNTLVAHDSSGGVLWSVADGTLFSGLNAYALAAGASKVALSSWDGALGMNLDILSAADGSRSLPQFTVGADSTDGYDFFGVAIG